jgi:hypothetical protein
MPSFFTTCGTRSFLRAVHFLSGAQQATVTAEECDYLVSVALAAAAALASFVAAALAAAAAVVASAMAAAVAAEGLQKAPQDEAAASQSEA